MLDLGSMTPRFSGVSHPTVVILVANVIDHFEVSGGILNSCYVPSK